MTENRPKGLSYTEEVARLTSTGIKNADAVRQVAAAYNTTEGAVRGGIYAYAQRHGGGARGGARGEAKAEAKAEAKPTTVDDFLGHAKQAVQDAIHLIEQEVAQAKEALTSAQARYDSAAASFKERKAELEKKLKALTGP